MNYFKKIRIDEFVYDDEIKLSKKTEKLIKELDYRHFETVRFIV